MTAPNDHTTPPCSADVCVTCSDTAVAVTIVTLLDDGLAIVDVGEGEEEISVGLVDARPGDTVLVHAKEAIAVVRGSAAGAGQPAGLSDQGAQMRQAPSPVDHIVTPAGAAVGDGPIETLYAFLHPGQADLAAILAQAR